MIYYILLTAGGVGTAAPLTSRSTSYQTTLKPTNPPPTSVITTKVFTTIQTSTGKLQGGVIRSKRGTW